MKTTSKLNAWWKAFSQNRGNRRILIAAGIIWAFLHLFLTWTISLDNIIGLALLVIAVYAYDRPFSLYLFLGGVIFFLMSSPLTSVGLVILVMYLLYRFLDSRRLARIARIAKMAPGQLSKVSYHEPEVEIVIRGGRRR